MWLRTFAVNRNRFTERISFDETADIYLGIKQRRRLRIAGGAHKVPIVGEIVIKAPDSGIRRTRGAYGRAETDCIQTVAQCGVIACRQVTPKSADDGIKPQTTRITGRSVPWAAGDRGGQRVIAHDARGIRETQRACAQGVGRDESANSGRLRKSASLVASENERTVLPDRSSHCRSEPIVLELGIRNSQAITIPCIGIEVVVLEVFVKSAVKGIRAAFGDEGKLLTLPTTVTGIGIGRSDAELLNTVRGKWDWGVDDIGCGGLHTGADDVVRRVNAIYRQSRLVAARPCHRCL